MTVEAILNFCNMKELTDWETIRSRIESNKSYIDTFSTDRFSKIFDLISKATKDINTMIFVKSNVICHPPGCWHQEHNAVFIYTNYFALKLSITMRYRIYCLTKGDGDTIKETSIELEGHEEEKIQKMFKDLEAVVKTKNTIKVTNNK